jgi:methyl-accepting chemotaxis protein
MEGDLTSRMNVNDKSGDFKSLVISVNSMIQGMMEVIAGLSRTSSAVMNNADNVAQANQLAMAAHEQAERGGRVVGTAVTAMGEINTSSKKIGDIIGVINEIAC